MDGKNDQDVRTRPLASAGQALAAIPVRADGPAPVDCGAAEPYALRVLGEAMLPEFEHGDVIVVEPEGLATDGSFVVAWWHEEWTFRQLRREAGAWVLVALNPAFPCQPIPDLAPVRGVVVQKSRPGRRRMRKHYVDPA